MTSLRIGSHAPGHGDWEHVLVRAVLLGVPAVVGAWVGFTALVVVLWHTA